jgi:hypothetical protein
MVNALLTPRLGAVLAAYDVEVAARVRRAKSLEFVRVFAGAGARLRDSFSGRAVVTQSDR